MIVEVHSNHDSVELVISGLRVLLADGREDLFGFPAGDFEVEGAGAKANLSVSDAAPALGSDTEAILREIGRA